MTQTTTIDSNPALSSSNASGSSLVDWAIAQRKALLAGILALLVAVGSWSAYQSSKASTAKKAAAALFEAKKLGTESEAGLAALDKVSKDFVGSHAAWEALMLLGDHHSKKAPQADLSASWYEKADQAATDPRQKLLSRYNLAYARELQGKWDLAFTAIESAERLGLPIFKSELALTRGRLLERMGKTSEARQAYEAVAKDFADSEAARTADQWKALLPAPNSAEGKTQ